MSHDCRLVGRGLAGWAVEEAKRLALLEADYAPRFFGLSSIPSLTAASARNSFRTVARAAMPPVPRMARTADRASCNERLTSSGSSKAAARQKKERGLPSS